MVEKFCAIDPTRMRIAPPALYLDQDRDGPAFFANSVVADYPLEVAPQPLFLPKLPPAPIITQNEVGVIRIQSGALEYIEILN